MEDKFLCVSICYQLRLTVDSVALSFSKSEIWISTKAE